MNDTKIKLIRKLPEGDSLLILWIGLLCLGMKSGRAGMLEIGEGIPFTDEALSVELDIPVNTVRLGLKTFVSFKMIEMWGTGETFIINFEKHQELQRIEKAKEISRESSRKYREKLLIGDGHVTVGDGTDVTESDDTDKEEDKEKEEEKEKDNKRFKKPTIEEIGTYCLERKNNIDPEVFFHHYESKDWMIGKNKMKKWKSAIVTWEKKNQKKQEPKMYATYED